MGYRTNARLYKLATELTLAELKAKNEADEKKLETDGDEFLDSETDDDKGDELDSKSNKDDSETGDTDGDTPDTETDDDESEAFLETDQATQEGDDEKLFTDGDVAAAKRKLKGKLGEANSEIDALKAEIDQLKQGKPMQVDTAKPVRADFIEEADPDEAYTDALVEWKFNQGRKSGDRTQAIERAKKSLDEKVDLHYENASKLIKEHGISEEVYQSADRSFRSSIEGVLPGKGDIIADVLIANLGEGSEKVVFHIGRNKTKLKRFQDLLVSDPSGVQAAMYVAEIKSSWSSTNKQIRKPPSPATPISGDTPAKGSKEARAFEKSYKTAHEKGNHQAAYDAKKKAKAAGVDVSNW